MERRELPLPRRRRHPPPRPSYLCPFLCAHPKKCPQNRIPSPREKTFCCFPPLSLISLPLLLPSTTHVTLPPLLLLSVLSLFLQTLTLILTSSPPSVTEPLPPPPPLPSPNHRRRTRRSQAKIPGAMLFLLFF
ncbi:formin-like protein 1 [Iris pallida]|uniref:Formin-like protein 1 n=1 Tax=Iris pallida TaxID=29817 RepID=A0AAX6EM85_IRIPA|nr:formin-like protein 1 [Iris pallida]